MASDSASNGDGDERSDSFTPLSSQQSTPPSTINPTHDTSRANYHIKDLATFAASLENSARRAFPNHRRPLARYKNVQVLLLQWKEDDLEVCFEVDDLDKVFKAYGFATEKWLIPSENSHLKLMLKAANFVESHDSLDTLFVIYYGGHATINAARQSTWSCKRDIRFASLEWSAIQTVFEKAESDALLLLDCCSAASAAPMAGRAVTETLAACGWESIAPEPGRWSFTYTLVEILQEWINRPFTAAMLHSELLSRLKHEKPEIYRNQPVERRRTPIYIVTTTDLKACSIQLSRLAPASISPTHGSENTLEGHSEGLENSGPAKRETESLMGSSPDGGLKAPHVLISLALDEDQTLDTKACSDWLASFPALAKYAKVESAYKSYSTLLLLSVPVVIWDLLPEDAACSFVGYVASGNLLDIRRHDAEPLTNQSTTKTLSKQADDLTKIKVDDAQNRFLTMDDNRKRKRFVNDEFQENMPALPGIPEWPLKSNLENVRMTSKSSMGFVSEYDVLAPYILNYWESFDPLFPIVHKPTYQIKYDRLLCLAMAGIGSQYVGTAEAASRGSEFIDACKQGISRARTWNLYTEQAIFLLEFFQHFRGRKVTIRLSKEFETLYRKLVEYESQTNLDSIAILLEQSQQANLKVKWATWVKHESRHRLWHACFVFDTQQAVYRRQPRSQSFPPENDLPSLLYAEFSDPAWAAANETEWGLEMVKGQFSNTWWDSAALTEMMGLQMSDHVMALHIPPDQVEVGELLNRYGNSSRDSAASTKSMDIELSGGIKILPIHPVHPDKQSLHEFSQQRLGSKSLFVQSILVCAQVSQLPAPDITSYMEFCGLESLSSVKFNSLPYAQQKTSFILACYLTPLHDLLAITGDSWLFGKKMTPPSAFHDASIRLKVWSSSMAAAKATQSACRVLAGEFNRDWNFGNNQPIFAGPRQKDRCLSHYWMLYICCLICWAFGHRYENGHASEIFGDFESTTDIGRVKAHEIKLAVISYLDQMAGLSLDEILTSKATLKGNTFELLHIVRLELENENTGSMVSMLVDAIGCLKRIENSIHGKWF